MAKGWHQTEEAKQKVRDARLGRKHSPETREKIRQSQLHRNYTPEQRDKMKRRMLGNTYALGNTLTLDQCAKMSRSKIGHPVSNETKRKISLANSIRPRTDAELERLRSYNENRIFTETHRRKISEAGKGRIKSPEARAKLSQSLTGKPLSPEHCAKIGKIKKQSWQDTEWRNKVILSQIVGREEALKRDPEWRAKQIEAQRKGYSLFPNKAESVLLALLEQDYPSEWAYVGNGSLIIGNWNPDFTNVNGRKELIELFGDHWHRGQDPQDRIDLFKKFGFRTLVIWEHELNEPDRVRERIALFTCSSTRKN